MSLSYTAIENIGIQEPRGWDPEKQELSIYHGDSDSDEDNEIPTAHQDEFEEDQTDTEFEQETDAETGSTTSTSELSMDQEINPVFMKVLARRKPRKAVSYTVVLQEESDFEEE